MRMWKKWLLISMIASLSPATAVAFQNEPDGFRNIKWGDDFHKNSKEMTPIINRGKDSLYFRRGDKPSIGSAQLSNVGYGYFDGKFISAYLQTVGETNKQLLIMAFKENFGEPIQKNQFLDEYSWNGAVTTINLNCDFRNSCSALIVSTEYMKSEYGRLKQSAQDSKSDF